MYNILITIIIIITILKFLIYLELFNRLQLYQRESFKTCGSKYLEPLSPYDSYNSITHSWCVDKLPKNLKSKRGKTIDDVNKCYGELF
jgi:hypothetical protein